MCFEVEILTCFVVCGVIVVVLLLFFSWFWVCVCVSVCVCACVCLRAYITVMNYFHSLCFTFMWQPSVCFVCFTSLVNMS